MQTLALRRVVGGEAHGRPAVQQPHTEQTIHHTDDQQNTGSPTQPGVDNSEGRNRDSREESIETGTDVDRVSGLDEVNTSTKRVDNLRERHPERDEHGRL